MVLISKFLHGCFAYKNKECENLEIMLYAAGQAYKTYIVIINILVCTKICTNENIMYVHSFQLLFFP